MARSFQVTVKDRRGRPQEILEVEDPNGLRRAQRYFNVACRYGTPAPGRKPKQKRRQFEVTLVAGYSTPAKCVYGFGCEPEQMAPGFKSERLLGVCRKR